MNDYYEPTLLFRQNAIRKYQPALLPIASMLLVNVSSPRGLWLLNHSNPSDTEVLSKLCSLNRLNIKSNYWKIPDAHCHLTAMDVTADNNPQLAIASGSQEANLFIYELDVLDNYLTHHTTISLPNVHALKWVPGAEKYLVTGNSKGYAHLVHVPGHHSDESAEIIKRFNHRKHLRAVNKDPSIFSHASTTILRLEYNVHNDRLYLVYDDTLFLWDMRDCELHQKPRPTSVSSIKYLTNFDLNKNSDNVVGICGRFGVSLFDTRQKEFSVPLLVVAAATRHHLGATSMRWLPSNDAVFAAAHTDGVVRLWDIRKQELFAALHGHQGKKITSMEWNHRDLFSAGADGNIVHWDLSSDVPKENYTESGKLTVCGLKEGVDSVNFNAKRNSVEATLSQRQCGTVLPASNSSIAAMCSVKGPSGDVDDVRVLSIDGSAFFGVHLKIYDAVNVHINNSKAYYTASDIDLLMAAEASGSTIIGLAELLAEVTAPLALKNTALMLAETLFSDSENGCQKATLGSAATLKKLRQKSQKSALPAPKSVSHHSRDLSGLPSFGHRASVKSPKTPAQVVCLDSEDDFDFTVAPSPVFGSVHDSAISVDSSVNLPLSLPGLNDSMDTLSTNPTIVESESPEKTFTDIDFKLLDMDFGGDFNFSAPEPTVAVWTH